MDHQAIAEIISIGSQYGVLLKAPMPGYPRTATATYPVLVSISADLYNFMLVCVKVGAKTAYMGEIHVNVKDEIMSVVFPDTTTFYIYTSNLTAVRKV